MLWSPPDQGSIARLESVFRNFTSQVAEFESLDYWERLAELEIYSQERRRERCSIMFMWKISQQLVQGYNVEFIQNPRRGRLAVVPSPSPCTAPARVKNAREASFKVKGSRLFNLIPMELRGMDGSLAKFKAGLDSWLSSIPDQPTIRDRQRAAQTNSLLDQVPLHQHTFT